jgi:precorrin-2 dehydrogenase / sirohydrochlorin ferrochelatase
VSSRDQGKAPRSLYPILVDLVGKRCVVIGGGPVAERKVSRLLQCGAEVCVVSPEATDSLAGLASSGRITLQVRPARPSDLAGAFLVFAATNDPGLNRVLADTARRQGSLVNVADDPAGSSFHVPSRVQRGDLTITISTAGGSPALAKKLRQRLEATIGPEYEAFLVALRTLRAQAQERIADPAARQALYRQAVESDLFEDAAAGRTDVVAARIEALVQAAAERETELRKRS